MSEGQYFIVRFSPDPVRDEPVNIGMVMVGDFEPRVVFPDESLKRAAQWCTNLNQDGFVSMRDYLTDEINRAVRQQEDLGSAIRPDLLGSMFGPVTVSSPRWVDAPASDPEAVQAIFDMLVNRLVMPPRQAPYGGGKSERQRVAKNAFDEIRNFWPQVRRDEPLVGKSGRDFVADVFVEWPRPLVVTALHPTSSTVGIHQVEAKAFNLVDIARSMPEAQLATVCAFPPIDPKGVKEETRKIMKSIDVLVVTPEQVSELPERVSLSHP